MSSLTRLEDRVRNQRLVLFLGADLPATITGLPSRGDLARGMAQQYGVQHQVSLASVAQRMLQSGNRWAFTDYLKSQLDIAGKKPQRIHQLIVQLPVQTIITTAYDSLLDMAFEQHGIRPNRIIRNTDGGFADPQRPAIIKLYGDIQQHDTLIVTEDDHVALWRNRDKENLLDDIRSIARQNTILFIGHSLADPDFHLLWREVLDRMGRFAVGAYAIWPGLSAEEIRVWADRQIQIINDDPITVLTRLVESGAQTAASLPTTGASSAAAVADLEIWLQHETHPSYRAAVTFRPPGSLVDQGIAGTRPQVTLDEEYLLRNILDREAYGSAITDMLFADERLRATLDQAQQQAIGARVPLRVRLRLDADQGVLHAIRWELLRHPTMPEQPFLCPDGGILFSRYLASADATPIALPSTLTALVGVAAPHDLDQYGLATINPTEELAPLQQALDGIPTTILERTTLSAIAAALLTGPSILYLICHGTLRDGHPYLWLEGPNGKAEPIAGRQFVDHIIKLARRPVLIVLAACLGAGQSHQRSDPQLLLGPQLAHAGIGAVLVMHDNVAISTVRLGMPVLFAELRRHGQVDRAVAAMRNILMANADDWWQPVLFLRLRDGQLCASR